MGSKEKLIERFCKLPKDFTYEETLKLLSSYGYNEHNKGATSGSRVRFKNEQTGQYIDIHKPHPGSIMFSSSSRVPAFRAKPELV